MADRMIARGLPPEGVALASARLAAINAAWEEIAARLRAQGLEADTVHRDLGRE